MPDPGSALLLHCGTFAACVTGMAWLALGMEVHARQVWGRALAAAAARRLRAFGATALLAGLVCALAADHPTMAVLVWIMAMAAAALAIALTLAWRAQWLRWLAPWVRPGRGPGRRVRPGPAR